MFEARGSWRLVRRTEFAHIDIKYFMKSRTSQISYFNAFYVVLLARPQGTLAPSSESCSMFGGSAVSCSGSDAIFLIKCPIVREWARVHDLETPVVADLKQATNMRSR